MSTLIKTIVFDYDLIEIHYSPLLKNKPYLVRIYNWDSSEPNELRVNEIELKNLYSILKADLNNME